MLFAEAADGNLGMPADPTRSLCNMEMTESSGRQCQDNTGQYAKEYIRAYSVAGSSRTRSVAWI